MPKAKNIYVWANHARPLEQPRLPIAYQEVIYIQSTWEEVIDTWLQPLYGHTYDIEIDFKRIDQDTNTYTIAWHMRNCYVWFAGWDFNVSVATRIISYWGFTSYSFTPNTYGYNTRYLFEWTWNTWDIDAMSNLVLFARRTSLTDAISARLYSCKIREDNVLLREFVPCYRKSDNEPWLYDIENDVFYANDSWSWAFIAWPTV